MNRISRSLLDSLRGGLHPREVALAVSLGLLAGFLTGGNLCFAAVLVAVLVLNAPWRVFAQCWILGWGLSILATPLTASTGRWLLDRAPLAGIMARVYESPWFVLSDLDRYVVLGGLVCGAALAIPAGALAAKLAATVQGRGKALALVASSPSASMLSFPVRMANWLLCGGVLQPAPVAAARTFRRRGLLLAVCSLGPLATAGYCLCPQWTQEAVLQALTDANRAQVDAGSVRLSLASGKLEIHDLQLADPQHLDRDRLRVGYVAAKLKPGSLLRGEVRIERLLLEDVNGDTVREARADALGLELPDFDRLAAEPETAPPVTADGARPLQDCLNDWTGVQMRLSRVQELLATIEELSGIEADCDDRHRDAATSDASAGFADLRRARHRFGPARPKVHIELAAVKRLSHRFGLGPQAVIEIANLSSNPQLTGKATRVALTAPVSSFEMAAMLNLHRPGDHHELRFKAVGINLPRAIEPSLSRTELGVEQGKLNIAGRGWGDSSQFEMQLKLDARDLRARVPATGGSFGLTAETWNQGLSQIDRLEASAVLFGNWTSPRLRIDGRHLVGQFRRQVQGTGDTALAARIDEQLGEPVAVEAPQQIAAVAPAAVATAQEEGSFPAKLPATTTPAPSEGTASATNAAPVVAAAPRFQPEERPRYMAVEHRRPGDPASFNEAAVQPGALPSPEVAASEAKQSMPEAAAALLPAAEAASPAIAPIAGQTIAEQTSPTASAVPNRTAANVPDVNRYAPKLQYPESLRTVSAETPAEAPVAANAPAASLKSERPAVTTEPAPAVLAEAEPQYAMVAKPAHVAQQPLDKVAAPARAGLPANAAIASGRTPPPAPAGLELGYDARKNKNKATANLPAPAAIVSAPAEVEIERLPKSEPIRQSLSPSSPRPATVAMTESLPVTSAPAASLPRAAAGSSESPRGATPANDSRVGNWTKAFVSKVKGFAPKLDKKPAPATPVEEIGAEAVVSDEPAPQPPASTAGNGGANVQASAIEPAFGPDAAADVPATPWYKRFWR